MWSPLRHSTAAAALAVGVFAGAVPAMAGPVHPHLSAAQAPLVAPRAARGGALVVPRFAPAAFRFAARTPAVAPIRALPLVAVPAQLVAPRTPLRMLPFVLSRLGLATLLAPLTPGNCARRSPVLLATLPASAFSPISCDGAYSPGSAGRDPLTSLVPGRDRKALYGRAYAPRSDETDAGAPSP